MPQRGGRDRVQVLQRRGLRRPQPGRQPLRPAADAVAPFGERVEELPDRLLLYTVDGERAQVELAGAGFRPMSALIRRSSLEDVFLRLTGRTLVD